MAVLLLLVAPPLFAVLIVALASVGILSFEPTQREVAELAIDIAARTFLISSLLLRARWSYAATTLYMVLLTLYAAVNASFSEFSAVDGASLGFFLLINGTTLQYLYQLRVPRVPAASVSLIAKAMQAVGLFLMIGSLWGGIIATFVVILVFGARLILNKQK